MIQYIAKDVDGEPLGPVYIQALRDLEHIVEIESRGSLENLLFAMRGQKLGLKKVTNTKEDSRFLEDLESLMKRF